MCKSLLKKYLRPNDVIKEGYAASRQTLANMRSQRRGPRYHKIGGRILYSRDDLNAWVRSGIVQTTDSIESDHRSRRR